MSNLEAKADRLARKKSVQISYSRGDDVLRSSIAEWTAGTLDAAQLEMLCDTVKARLAALSRAEGGDR